VGRCCEVLEAGQLELGERGRQYRTETPKSLCIVMPSELHARVGGANICANDRQSGGGVRKRYGELALVSAPFHGPSAKLLFNRDGSHSTATSTRLHMQLPPEFGLITQISCL